MQKSSFSLELFLLACLSSAHRTNGKMQTNCQTSRYQQQNANDVHFAKRIFNGIISNSRSCRFANETSPFSILCIMNISLLSQFSFGRWKFPILYTNLLPVLLMCRFVANIRVFRIDTRRDERKDGNNENSHSWPIVDCRTNKMNNLLNANTHEIVKYEMHFVHLLLLSRISEHRRKSTNKRTESAVTFDGKKKKTFVDSKTLSRQVKTSLWFLSSIRVCRANCRRQTENAKRQLLYSCRFLRRFFSVFYSNEKPRQFAFDSVGIQHSIRINFRVNMENKLHIICIQWTIVGSGRSADTRSARTHYILCTLQFCLWIYANILSCASRFRFTSHSQSLSSDSIKSFKSILQSTREWLKQKENGSSRERERATSNRFYWLFGKHSKSPTENRFTETFRFVCANAKIAKMR